IAIAQQVRQELLAYSGDLDKFNSAALDAKASSGESVAVFIYIRDHFGDALSEKLGPEKWTEFRTLKIPVHSLQPYAITADRATSQESLLSSLDEPWTLSISPDGRHVAWAIELPGQDSFAGR